MHLPDLKLSFILNWNNHLSASHVYWINKQKVNLFYYMSATATMRKLDDCNQQEEGSLKSPHWHDKILSLFAMKILSPYKLFVFDCCLVNLGHNIGKVYITLDYSKKCENICICLAGTFARIATVRTYIQPYIFIEAINWCPQAF